MSSYVYAYHVPDINAIKVGKADHDPMGRLNGYTTEHGINADPETLHVWHCPTSEYAVKWERELHLLLISINHSRITMGSARELFKLEQSTYSDVVDYLNQQVASLRSKAARELFPDQIDAELQKAREEYARIKKASTATWSRMQAHKTEHEKNLKEYAAEKPQRVQNYAIVAAFCAAIGLMFGWVIGENNVKPRTITERIEVPVERIVQVPTDCPTQVIKAPSQSAPKQHTGEWSKYQPVQTEAEYEADFKAWKDTAAEEARHKRAERIIRNNY